MKNNSNVFAMFDKAQVMEFKYAFSIMDTNNDGLIDENDLQLTFERIGQPATKEEIKSMIQDSTGDINFTVFLTLMADKLSNTDEENKVLKAFSAFDENGNGAINASYLRDCITSMGDKFSEEEVSEWGGSSDGWIQADVLFKDFINDDTGDFYYRDFVRVLKRGE